MGIWGGPTLGDRSPSFDIWLTQCQHIGEDGLGPTPKVRQVLESCAQSNDGVLRTGELALGRYCSTCDEMGITKCCPVFERVIKLS